MPCPAPHWGILGCHSTPDPKPFPAFPYLQCKEEVLGTVDAVQVLASVGQLLPKSRENYLSRCMDVERLRRENTSQKEMDKVCWSHSAGH